MNLGDPQLELTDPTPDVHALFARLDRLLFWDLLSERVTVKWSKRMFCNAGICWHRRAEGLCDIVLSEPLLKLRSRKNLLETLLHEMIHAFLFLTDEEASRDYHGPGFQAHMARINRATGLDISVYHDYHEEVGTYRAHWWCCNGPCQDEAPNFGIIRKFVNRAPGPSNQWWQEHQDKCGGTFIKIKAPEKRKIKITAARAVGTRGVDRIGGRSGRRCLVRVPRSSTITTEKKSKKSSRKRKLDTVTQPPLAKHRRNKLYRIALQYRNMEHQMTKR